MGLGPRAPIVRWVCLCIGAKGLAVVAFSRQQVQRESDVLRGDESRVFIAR